MACEKQESYIKIADKALALIKAPIRTPTATSGSEDAKKRQLGNLDFSPRNWFSYARGYRTPENSVKHYKEKFLPEIKDTYKELVDNHKLFFNGKQVIGVIDGKQIHLKNTESKMAYIVTNTPSGKKLYFNGEVASTGIPA